MRGCWNPETEGNQNYAVVTRIKRIYLVQIQLDFALIAFHRTAKSPVATVGAYVAGLFVSNPFFGAELSSIWDSPENNLLADGHREIVNVVARKLTALMAPGVSLVFCAAPDLTLAAMHKLFIR